LKPAPSWYRAACQAISRALDEGRERGLAGAALLKHVDEAYPFGPRQHFPYKMWLKARKRLCRTLLPARKSEEVDPRYWLNLTDPDPEPESRP